jgi:hypothetical protein
MIPRYSIISLIMNTKQEEPEEIIENDLLIVSTGDGPARGLTSERGQSMTGLIEAMKRVDTTSSDAEANKTSISDNNGSRIELNEDLSNPTIIKK